MNNYDYYPIILGMYYSEHLTFFRKKVLIKFDIVFVIHNFKDDENKVHYLMPFYFRKERKKKTSRKKMSNCISILRFAAKAQRKQSIF